MREKPCELLHGEDESLTTSLLPVHEEVSLAVSNWRAGTVMTLPQCALSSWRCSVQEEGGYGIAHVSSAHPCS